MNLSASPNVRSIPRVLDPSKMKPVAPDVSGLMKTLGHPDRLLVICQLIDGEKSVGEIARLIDISQPALSQHLARLRNEGLVDTRREAQTIYYSVISSEAEQIVRLLYDLFGKSARRSQRKRS